MTRVKTLTKSLSIWIFANDHAPPHRVRSPETDVLMDLRTLQVLRGDYERRHLATALAWAEGPENMALLEAKWRRLNEHD